MHPTAAFDPTRRRRLAGLLLAGALVPGALAACGGDDDTTGTTDATGAVEVTGAWARTSPMMTTAGAAYLTVTSPVDDRLVGAAVDPSVAATVELHETVMADGDMADGDMADGDMADGDMAHGGMGGEMTMQPVDGIDLPAGTAVGLEPGGLHVMLLDLAAPLTVGTTFELTLTFEQAGEQTVTVEVREDAP